MAHKLADTWRSRLMQISSFVSQPLFLASLPAVCLGLYWFFGETALLTSALVLPLLVFAVTQANTARTNAGVDPTTGMMTRKGFDDLVSTNLGKCSEPGLRSSVFKIEIDEHDVLIDRYGAQATDDVIQQVGHRIALGVADFGWGHAHGRLRFCGLCASFTQA